MTREEAIDRLKNTAWLGTEKDREETEQAIDMAIEALSQPIIAKCYEIGDDHIYCSPEVAHKIFNALKDRQQGEWEIEERECIYGKKFILTCSICGDSVSVTEASLPHEKYCRNCGADMRGGTE